MVMLKPAGKAAKISKNVMKNKNIKQTRPKSKETKKLNTPYLQH